MKEHVKNAVWGALSGGASLADLIEILRVHKDQGLTQELAYDALVELRSTADGGSQDRLLELMDVVSGYCQPKYSIWHSTPPKR
jgi:hypothetical protein